MAYRSQFQRGRSFYRRRPNATNFYKPWRDRWNISLTPNFLLYPQDEAWSSQKIQEVSNLSKILRIKIYKPHHKGWVASTLHWSSIMLELDTIAWWSPWICIAKDLWEFRCRFSTNCSWVRRTSRSFNVQAGRGDLELWSEAWLYECGSQL